MTDTPIEPTETDVLAGELALRVLSPSEEAEGRRREASDPAFAADVAAWNEQLAGLAAQIPAVVPSPDVWPRIASGVAPVAANDNQKVVFWRRWAVGSTGLLAASLAAVIFMAVQPAPVAPIPPPTEPAGVTRVATLSLEGGAAVVTLVYDTASGRLYIAPTQAMQAGGQVPHLWLVTPEGGVRLIGAIDGEGNSRRELSDALSGVAGAATAVAISLEAPGHTPALDKPDGPVIASGELQQL